MAPILEDSLGQGVENTFAAALYGPVVAQILLGMALIAAGVVILVLGHRRYRRRQGKYPGKREK